MDLPALWRRQNGVARHGQLLEHLSRWAVPRMVTAGELVRVHPRVYRLAAYPETPRNRVRAAALWAPDGAVLHGVAAAYWWELHPDPPQEVVLAVPPALVRRAPAGVRLVRIVLGPRDTRIVDDVRVTDLALTVLDAAVALGATRDSGGAGRKMVDRALQKVVTLGELRAAHAGRPRGRAAAEVDGLLRQLGDRTASEPERRVVAALRAAGLEGFVVNHRLHLFGRDVVIDIAFLGIKLAVEVQGWAWHREHDRFVDDARRRTVLVRAGWTILEVTWADLVERPEQVVADIRAVLVRLGALV